MWRIPSSRIALDLDGPLVEVEPVLSWMLQFEGVRLLTAFMGADNPEDEYATLAALIDRFVAEGRPTWAIEDHLGPIPATGRGMSRLPVDMQLAILSQWLETLQVAEEAPVREPLPFSVVESDAPSAVDAVLPPGPANREVKRRLRAAKRAA